MEMYVFVVLIVALSGFLHGYIVDITNKLIDQKSFVDFIAPAPGPFVYYYYTCFYAGQGVGLVFCYFMSDRVGRKTTLLYCSAFLAAIFSWASTTNSETQTLLTRFLIGGISVILLATSIVYLIEVSLHSARAMTITVIPLLIQAGKLASTLLFAVTKAQDENWRVCMGVSVLLSLGMLVGVTSIPESTRWLLAYRTPGEGLSALKQLRSTSEVMVEFNTIFRAVVTDAKYESLWHTIISDVSLRYRLCLIIVLMMCYGACNMLCVQSQTLYLRSIGMSTHDIVVSHQVLKCFAMLCTFTGGYVLETSRRLSVLRSLAILLLSLLTLCAVYTFIDTKNMLLYYFIQYVLFICYLACFASLFAVFYPMVFLLPAEIFPLRHRSRSITVALLLGRATMLGFGQVPVSTALHVSLISLGVCALALGFFYIALPETAGVLFSEMDSLFSVEEGETRCGIFPLRTADGYIGWRVMSSNPSDPPSWLAYRSRPSFASDTTAASIVSRSNEKKTMGKRRTSGGGVKKGILSYQHSSPFTYSTSSLRPSNSSEILDQSHKYSQQLRDSAFQYLESNEDTLQTSEWFGQLNVQQKGRK